MVVAREMQAGGQGQWREVVWHDLNTGCPKINSTEEDWRMLGRNEGAALTAYEPIYSALEVLIMVDDCTHKYKMPRLDFGARVNNLIDPRSARYPARPHRSR
jgi:hypothetical protein